MLKRPYNPHGRESNREGRGALPADRTRQLIARSCSGDTTAFDALVTEYRDHLFQVIHPHLRDPEDAVDALQEAFIRAYRVLHKYNPREPFFPWLAGVALNCCKEWRRNERTRPTSISSLPPEETEEIDELSEESETMENSLVDPWPGPEEQYEMKETHDLVLDMVHRLSTQDRLIVTLRCQNQLSCQQVGDTIGMSAEQVYRRLFACRRWLEQQLHGILESRVWSEP